MTDNEIIKALECVSGKIMYCRNCPYTARYPMSKCREQCAKDALDLINRQKAEIERLEANNLSMQKTLSKMSLGVEQARAEAIKDFAERLKELINPDWCKIHQQIDNLVKEMIGEQE